MRHYLTALRVTGIAGLLIGAGVGLRDWSPAWPGLSLAVALRPAAVGWLIGLCLSPLLGWAFARRRVPQRVGVPPKWRRALSIAISVVAVAPAALWLVLLLPINSLRPATVSQRSPGDSRPNLILITIDALRADHVGAYGSDRGLTRNIDAFAQHATVYDAAYVSSPWTFPSFASVFSGRPPSECGLKVPGRRLHDWYSYSAKLPEGIPFLSEQLQGAGYTTAAELTNCFLTAERGWRRGFDYFRNEDGPELGAILTSADTVTENAVDWLELNRQEPFFLWVHFLDPHSPYNSPETPAELWESYPSEWITRQRYWYETMRRQDEKTRARYQDFCRRLYAEEVRYTDRWVGELLDALQEAVDFDNSLVVISSDHGEELFDHGQFEHGHSLYEELLRVPLLVKWPLGWEHEKSVTQTVGLISLGRTFTDAAGVPPEMDSVRGLPRRDGELDTEIFSEGMFWGSERTALTTGDYKIIYHPYAHESRPRFEVYDRRHDRAEQHNIAESEDAAALRERLVRLTRDSETAAKQWQPSREQEFRGIDLSNATREKLKALGYIGN